MEEDGEKKDLLMNNNPNILIYQNENGNIKVDVMFEDADKEEIANLIAFTNRGKQFLLEEEEYVGSIFLCKKIPMS